MDLDHAQLLEYLLNITRHMVEMRSLDPLLAFVIDESLKIVGAEQGYIVLKREDGGLDFRILRDRNAQDLEPQPDVISRSILQEALTTGQSLVVRNAMTDPRFSHSLSVMALRLRSVMCVPLITQNHIVGAIYVENRSVHGRFSKEDVIPLELISHQAAVAIQNAKLNDELKIANDHLRQLDAMKNKFIMLISHELQTPLTSVKAYASLMRRVLDTADTEAKLAEAGPISHKLNRSVDRLNQTITEIIQLFRIISGQLHLDCTEIDLEQLLRHIIKRFGKTIEKRGIQIEIIDIDQLPHFEGDQSLLTVLFENVLGNAVKYTPDHGEIVISGSTHEDHIEIKIQDSGIGVPGDEQKRVFDLFHVLGSLLNHSSSKLSFQGGGLGLGLPTAKGIIEAHGGKICLISPIRENEQFPGTACTISMPLARADG